MKPYSKAQTIRLDEKHDRRVRLTKSQKKEIVELYGKGDVSHRELARMYRVSKTLIGLILNPELALKVKQRLKEHWREYYFRHGKQYHSEAVRNTRNYKYRLFMSGDIKETK